jgi:hypothetical protein
MADTITTIKSMEQWKEAVSTDRVVRTLTAGFPADALTWWRTPGHC